MSNKEKRQNIGLSVPFIVIASIIVLTIILLFIFPGNAINAAPLANKLIAGIFTAGAAYYAIGWSQDKYWNNITNDKIYFVVNIVIFIALLVAALLTLTVFHSGPIGVSTNPVS